jgi:hypothetical protein
VARSVEKVEARTRCEFKFIPHVCFGPLDPAHSKKRREMMGDDISTVALACRRIHDYLDHECSHERMEALVMKAIDRANAVGREDFVSAA